MRTKSTIFVHRWEPEKQPRPSYVRYEIPYLEEETVLEGLLYVRENVDATLGFRYSCRGQRCGSCALSIDGSVSLGCYTPLRDGQRISPLPGFPIVKDLMVDWSPYERRMQEIDPSLHQESQQLFYRQFTEQERDLANSAMTCIKCFSCVGACPSVELDAEGGFAGPAIAVLLASYMENGPRAYDLTSSVLDAGLQYCTRCYACNKVCPAEIDIVSSIRHLQRISGEGSLQGKPSKSTASIARALKQMVEGYL